MAFKSKAETMFEIKTKAAVENKDWNEVTRLFHLFGCYLELIAPILDPEPLPLHEPSGMELVYFQSGESTSAEEQEHVLSGGHAEFCIQTLHRDPITLEPLTDEQREQYGLVK